MAFTKEQLAKLGINIDTEEVNDEDGFKLIQARNSEQEANLKKQKDLIDKRNSEIAEFKRKDQEKMSEEEKTKLHYDELEKENATLTRKIARTDKINELLGAGYEKDLAGQIADAELEGKSTVSLHQKHVNALLEKQKAELLQNGQTPRVDETNQDSKFTKENFKKGLISMDEMSELEKSNPTLYKEIIS